MDNERRGVPKKKKKKDSSECMVAQRMDLDLNLAVPHTGWLILAK